MCRASTQPPPDNVVPLPGSWWLWPYIKHFHRLIWESKLQLFADSNPRTQEEFKGPEALMETDFAEEAQERHWVLVHMYVLSNIRFIFLNNGSQLTNGPTWLSNQLWNWNVDKSDMPFTCPK